MRHLRRYLAVVGQAVYAKGRRIAADLWEMLSLWDTARRVWRKVLADGGFGILEVPPVDGPLVSLPREIMRRPPSRNPSWAPAMLLHRYCLSRWDCRARPIAPRVTQPVSFD